MLWGKIEESEKAGSRPAGVEPRTPLAWATNALPLSHDSWTTTNPHNPAQVVMNASVTHLDSTINTKPVCESVIKSTMQTICFIIQHLMQVENYLTNQIFLPTGNLYRQSKAFWDQWNRWRYLFWPFGFLWGQNAVFTTSIRPQTIVLKPFSQLEVQCSTVHFFATKHCRDIPL